MPEEGPSWVSKVKWRLRKVTSGKGFPRLGGVSVKTKLQACATPSRSCVGWLPEASQT